MQKLRLDITENGGMKYCSEFKSFEIHTESEFDPRTAVLKFGYCPKIRSNDRARGLHDIRNGNE